MKEKIAEKEKAIAMRKAGHTYSEILEKVPVAKSTLSLWLREVGLSRPQKQKITAKRIAAALRGAQARKDDRIARSNEIYTRAENEIGAISRRELWLIGIALYWAEGTKEKEYRPGSGVEFTNSDPYMVRVYLRWLFETCDVTQNDIRLAVCIHKTSEHRLREVAAYWSQQTGFPSEHIRFYLKKHNPKTARKNIGESYYGNLRIIVIRSNDLVRKITGWSRGIGRSSGNFF